MVFEEKGLFAGLNELYDVWCKLSEAGSHANIDSICERFHVVDVNGQPEWRVSYTGGMDDKRWAMSIFDMLLTAFKMEETLFKDYRLRLQFDEGLLRMRKGFESKEQLRRALIERYDLRPPECPLIIP